MKTRREILQEELGTAIKNLGKSPDEAICPELTSKEQEISLVHSEFLRMTVELVEWMLDQEVRL